MGNALVSLSEPSTASLYSNPQTTSLASWQAINGDPGVAAHTVFRSPALQRPSVRSAFQNIANVQNVGRVNNILIQLFNVVYRMGSAQGTEVVFEPFSVDMSAIES